MNMTNPFTPWTYRLAEILSVSQRVFVLTHVDSTRVAPLGVTAGCLVLNSRRDLNTLRSSQYPDSLVGILTMLT